MDNTQQATANPTKTEVTTVTSEAPTRRVVVIRGRVAPPPERRVSWEEGIPENKDQRTSKKCCVFHRHRMFGESDTEEESSSGEDSDGEDKRKHKCTRDSCTCGHTRFA
eukprot:PhM_4_TR6970/c0_g1_i1/m.70778/K17553/PPP1R11; protein phosphatase 1 regulatory subunit 11